MVAVVNASGYKADLNSLSEGMQTFWPVESDYWDYSKAILRNGITDPDTLSLIDNYYLENPAGDNLYNYADDEAAQKDQNRQLSLFGSVTAGSVDGYVFWGSNYSRAGRLTAKEVADLKAANPELTTLSALNAYRDEVKQLGTLARNVGVLATACGLVEAHNKIKNAAAEGRSVDVVAVRETAKLTAMAAAGRIASGLGLQLLKIPMPQVKALGLAAVAVGLAMAMVNKLWDSYEDDIDDWITENVTDSVFSDSSSSTDSGRRVD